MRISPRRAAYERRTLALNKHTNKHLGWRTTDRACDVRFHEADSRGMKLRLSDGNLIALRAIVAAGFIGAFLFALVLSAAPQLHERIHESTGVNHECAVTLLTSGNCSQILSGAIPIAPLPPRPACRLSQPGVQLVSLRLEFSLLEHAPPALS